MAYTDPDNEADLMEWEADRGDLYEGDARVCPFHPHVKTSSPDGMFDGVCGECEYGMYEDSQDLPPFQDPVAERDRDADIDDLPHGVITPGFFDAPVDDDPNHGDDAEPLVDDDPNHGDLPDDIPF